MSGRGTEPASLASQLKTLQKVLDASGTHFDQDAVLRARRVLERADDRLRFGGAHTVVAVAGATGSGKSSLTNAIAGREVTEVAARRPTTAAPMACVWGTQSADLLLDWLGVPLKRRTRRESVLDVREQSDLDGLVLIDLPDHDSSVVTHRLEVDRLVGLVDLLIWVVDPQKYADEALHQGYLRKLADHAGVMLVVLNQVDRLRPVELDLCITDVRRLLDADGLAAVPLLATSATRGDGVDDLRDALVAAAQRHSAVAERVVVDVRAAARDLVGGLGDLDPDDLPGAGRLVHALSEAAGVPAMVRRSDTALLAAARRTVGWPPARWWGRTRLDSGLERLAAEGAAAASGTAGRRAAPPTPAYGIRHVSGAPASVHAKVDLAAGAVAAAVAEQLPAGWAEQARQVSLPGSPDVARAIDDALARVPLDAERPWWWTPVRIGQGLGTALLGLGLLWLAALGVLSFSGPAAATHPLALLGPVVPLVLGGLGAGLGLVLSAAGAAGVRTHREQHRRELENDLREAVAQVARTRVLQPLAAVVEDFQRTREALRSLL